MARAIWTGVITFGLVSVPVGLYTATEDHTVHFHQLQRGTADRIRNKRVNERTGKEVDTSDIVKGYEVDEGEYIVVEPDELDEIAPGRSQTIDISDFIDLDQIEPVYFDRTYYIAPRGKGGIVKNCGWGLILVVCSISACRRYGSVSTLLPGVGTGGGPGS